MKKLSLVLLFVMLIGCASNHGLVTMPQCTEKDSGVAKLIVIRSTQTLYHNGRPFFTANAGETLEIVDTKKCLDGYNLCWAVRKPGTSAVGFVMVDTIVKRHTVVVCP